MKSAREKLSTLEKSAAPSIDLRPLQQEIRDLNGQIAALDNADKLRARLAELINEEQRDVASNGYAFKHTKPHVCRPTLTVPPLLKRPASEDSVNAQFEYVKFKLFRLLANGDVKEDCAAMISGVPYSSLSKGEKAT